MKSETRITKFERNPKPEFLKRHPGHLRASESGGKPHALQTLREIRRVSAAPLISQRGQLQY